MPANDDPVAALGPHVFEPGASGDAPALLVLHGTGGDERDLLPLARAAAPGAGLFSVRGRVLENGMPRFFRRLSEGVFDEADVAARADELAETVRRGREAYGFAAPIAFGFSNGANIAAAVLARAPDALSGAVLLRAQAPFKDMPKLALPGTPVLLLNGSDDPLISGPEAQRLAQSLTEGGAALDHHVLPAGHGLVQDDLTLAQGWFAENAGASRG